MKGYSFRSLTDLVLKIFTTKVNAGTGLSGGGSLEADRTLTVNYGTTAGTAAEGNDSRLSDSREWSGVTITQAEAEAGTATTRRAFTAQRVRQAIVAWFNGISGALGRTILTRTTAAQVRSDIGLGTVATRNGGTASGQVLINSQASLMGAVVSASATTTASGYWEITLPYALNSLRMLSLQIREYSGYYLSVIDVSGYLGGHWQAPRSIVYGLATPSVRFSKNAAGNAVIVISCRQNPAIGIYNVVGGYSGEINLHGTTIVRRDTLPDYDYSEPTPVIINTSANINQSTGASTSFPMSQKATTDQLGTKASISTQVIAGTGLSGGGTLAIDRTLNISYGTTAGTSVQGNDSRVVNALQRSNNLSDIASTTLARSNLGLGVAATRDVGTASGNVLQVGAYGLGSYSGISPATPRVASEFGGGLSLAAEHTEKSIPSAIGSLNCYYNLMHLVGGPASNNSTHMQLFGTNLPGGRLFFRTSHQGKFSSSRDSWLEVHHTDNLLQTTGSSTNFPMSQKAVTDLFANMQPSITSSCTTNGSTNNTLALTGIVPALALEVGDVIQISGSANGLNDKLFTVETISNNSNIVVNYEHAGNRGNGSLRLANQSRTVTIKRIAKWYNAPIGMGQGWVDMTYRQVRNIIYTNTTGRSIVVFAFTRGPTSLYLRVNNLTIDGSGAFAASSNQYVTGVVPNGDDYEYSPDSAVLASVRALR